VTPLRLPRSPAPRRHGGACSRPRTARPHEGRADRLLV